MMVLLDTLFVYALADAPGKLPERARLVLANQDLQPVISAVSLWEMRLKWSSRHPSGDRKSPLDPETVLSVLEDQDVRFLPLTIAHAARSLQTPIPHKDPFDELLLVQAQEEGARLLTTDRLLAAHPLALVP